MTKKEKARNYFEELRKLIKKCHKGYKLVYDIDKGMFMVPELAEFDHGSSHSAPAILCSVGMNYTPHKSDTDGYMLMVAREISQDYVDLAAVSSNAEIDE